MLDIVINYQRVWAYNAHEASEKWMHKGSWKISKYKQHGRNMQRREDNIEVHVKGTGC
jgi:hypothetical protein